MKKKILPLILFATLLPLGAQNLLSPEKKISIVNYIIENMYVDSVDSEAVAEAAIVGMLKALDPHSSYLSADEVEEMNEPLVGNFDGVGIQFNMNNDTLYVIETIAGGPSERVGIRAGDRVIAVNDSTIAGVKLSTTAIMKRLRGKRGTEVEVTVLRQGEAQPIEFRITRDKIPIYSIDAAYMVDPHTGYIRITRFAADTHKEFLVALEQLEKEGMEQLIIDLQGNGGGYLSTAVDIADELLSRNKLIVYTQGRKTPRSNMVSTRGGAFEEGRVAILVDESSASASEILSGAVQDWDRGVIVGRRTFGKGLVQRQIPLMDKSQLRLTIARYYTPSGRCIQRPYGDGVEAYNHDMIDRYNSGELLSADSIHLPDSLRYTTLQNRRIVYGGGGIMPDLFVPIDTLRYTKYHRDIVAKGVLNSYNIAYIDQHRSELAAQYPTLEAYIAHYNVTPQMLEELLKLAEKKEVKFNAKEYEQSKPIIAQQLKALVARDLFETAAYTRIMNQYNDPLIEALELLGDKRRYNERLQN